MCGSLKWKSTDAQAKLHSSHRYSSNSDDDEDEHKFVVLPSDAVTSTLKKVFQDVDARFLEKAKKVGVSTKAVVVVVVEVVSNHHWIFFCYLVDVDGAGGRRQWFDGFGGFVPATGCTAVGEAQR